jgi:hypothetical protein
MRGVVLKRHPFIMFKLELKKAYSEHIATI